MWFERRCAGCGADGCDLCDRCAGRLREVGRVEPPAGLERCWSLFAYDDAGRAVVSSLKFRNGRGVVPLLAAGMAALVDDEVGPAVATVTWAPTSPARRAERGYDQSRLLAAQVAARLGRPCAPLLRRRRGPPQTGASRAARQVGPVFRARGRPTGVVLVIDDVLTTGATLSAAARALTVNGADAVVGLTAARTPAAEK